MHTFVNQKLNTSKYVLSIAKNHALIDKAFKQACETHAKLH